MSPILAANPPSRAGKAVAITRLFLHNGSRACPLYSTGVYFLFRPVDLAPLSSTYM
jgi:hypothetical protein